MIERKERHIIEEGKMEGKMLKNDKRKKRDKNI